MEKNNKKVIIVIALLLVSVIGISFSYFTASITRNNLTNSAVDTTVAIDNTEFIIEGKLSFNDLNILPGHKSVSSIKVTARGDHTINYNLIWDGINSLERLDYKVYKTTTEIVPTTTCRRIIEEGNGLTKYYEECNITNIAELGEEISSGSINKNTEITKEILKSDETITATKEGETVYYYVVLEFPNLDKDQNIDMNSKFEGEITVESNEVKFDSHNKGDLNILAMYIKEKNEYKEVEVSPSAIEYKINKSKSYCNINGTKDPNAILETYNGRHTIDKIRKGSKCYIYFDKIISPNVQEILTKYVKNDSRNGEINGTFTSYTPTTVYSTKDDDGESYVFAGVDPNNWVKLGNLYFRIIRFNGDGSLRLIYSGEGAAQTIGEGTQIGTKSFNTNNTDNMYVGLQYTSGEVHGNAQNSTILGEENSYDKTTLYGWYNIKIKPSYASLIDTNAGFCSDRSPHTDKAGTTPGGGLGTTATYYGSYIRYYKNSSWQTTVNPILTCPFKEDELKLPVGLITADEYAVAGGLGGYSNDSFWLYTGMTYWTITPTHFVVRSYPAYVFSANSSGYLWGCNSNNVLGVRPVINLKSSTTFTNNGTGAPGSSTNPYEVVVT